jgi:hypothetical protein
MSLGISDVEIRDFKRRFQRGLTFLIDNSDSNSNLFKFAVRLLLERVFHKFVQVQYFLNI